MSGDRAVVSKPCLTPTFAFDYLGMQRAHSRPDKIRWPIGRHVLASSPDMRAPAMERSSATGVSTAAPGALDTFPKRLLDHAARRGDKPANREKDYGIWQSWTWREIASQVGDLACGL